MPRICRRAPEDINQLEHEVANHFDDSPLSDIGRILQEQIRLVREAMNWVGMDTATVAAFCRRCQWVLKNVPSRQAIGERFWFDIHMIRSIADEWSPSGQLLPGSILPREGGEWQHSADWLPTFDAVRMPRLDIIDFPGNHGLETISLLTYPWLYHELGHILMYLHGKAFMAGTRQLLEQKLQETSQGCLGKPQAVKDRLKVIRERIEIAWRPSSDHHDWSHEIGIDIVALWSIGPAFLAAYEDALEGKPPHVADQTHPPYEVRTFAIVEAARRLGWQQYAAALEERLANWAKLFEESARDNLYLALFDQDIVNGVVTAAMAACGTLALPRCDQASIVAAQQGLDRNEIPAFGRPALIAAWVQYERTKDAPDVYHAWETNVIRSMSEEVTPSCQ